MVPCSDWLLIDAFIYAAWDPARMSIYFVSAVIFCICAALYPAWTISKLRPVQALRHH